jgi:hypothetical protein
MKKKNQNLAILQAAQLFTFISEDAAMNFGRHSTVHTHSTSKLVARLRSHACCDLHHCWTSEVLVAATLLGSK